MFLVWSRSRQLHVPPWRTGPHAHLHAEVSRRSPARLVPKLILGSGPTSSLVNCVDCAHSTIPDHRQGSPEEFLPSAPKGPLLNHPAPSHNWVRQIRCVRRVSPPCVFLVQSLVNVLFMCSLVRSHRPACLCLTAGPPYRRRP